MVRQVFLSHGELVPSVGVYRGEDGAARRRREAMAELAAASRAQSTRLAYGRHVEAWLGWAERNGLCPLPAVADDVVAEFIVAYALVLDGAGVPERDAAGSLRGRVVAATVDQFGAALTRLHVLAGLSSPLADPRVREVMAGLRRRLTSAPLRAKAALTWDLLVEVLDGGGAAASASGLRAGLARALHECAGATAGQLARLTWADVDLGEDRVVLHLPPSRRGAMPTLVRVRATRRRGCVVGSLRRWRDVSAGWAGVAVFRDATGKPLSRQGLHKVLTTVASDAPVAVTSAADVRDRALLLVGWNTALRRSNLAALKWDQLTRTAAGWSVCVARSKTDQMGRGSTVAVPVSPAGSNLPDAVDALDAWLALVIESVGRDPRRLRGVAVFSQVDRHGHVVLRGELPVPLSGAAVSAALRVRMS